MDFFIIFFSPFYDLTEIMGCKKCQCYIQNTLLTFKNVFS